VVHEDIFVACGDDIVVEDARVDGVWVLACKDDAGGIKLVCSGEGLAGGAGLAGGVVAGGVCGVVDVYAIDEEFDAWLVVGGGEADMVGGAFVGKAGLAGKRIVDGEVGWVFEDHAEGGGGCWVLS